MKLYTFCCETYKFISHFSITLGWLSKIVLVIFKVTFWPLQLWLCGGGEMLDVATHHWHVCWFPSIAFGNFKHFGQNVRANNRRLKESMHIWKHGNFQVLLLPGDLGCSIRAAHFLPPVLPFWGDPCLRSYYHPGIFTSGEMEFNFLLGVE